MLHIVVCVKAVPDPKEDHKIKIDPITRALDRGEVPLVLNSLDRHAIETALWIQEQVKAHITILSMGPPDASGMVKECLAYGADQGIMLSDPAFRGADAFATAFTLAKGIEKIGKYDMVLCGMASSDSGTEWVGPEIGVFLGTPTITRVIEIVGQGGEWWEVKAETENGFRRLKVKLPAVLTVTRKLNTPRALSFSGIVKAREREIIQWGISDLGLPEESVGLKGSPTFVSKIIQKESRREAVIIEGAREEKADILIRKLVEAGVL